jgi:hypothetical protein
MGRRSVLLRNDGIVHDCVEVQRSWGGTRTPHILHDQKVLDVSIEDLSEDVVSIKGVQRHVCSYLQTFWNTILAASELLDDRKAVRTALKA